MWTRLVSCAAIAVVLLALWIGRESSRLAPRDLPHDFTSHGLALQFAHTTEDVTAIAGPMDDPDRALLTSIVGIDTWLIVAYVLLFLIAGFIALLRRRLGAVRFLGLLAVAGLVAAWFDVRENAAMIAALGGEAPLAAPSAYLKWTFFFVAMLGMIPMAWRRDGPGALAAIAFGLGGVGGLLALWFPDHPIALGQATGAFGFGVVMVLLTPLNARLRGGFVGSIGTGVRWIDKHLRFFDLRANRTVGGWLGPSARHTWAAIVVPALLVLVIVNGPAVRGTMRLGLAAVVSALSAAMFWWQLKIGAARRHSFERDLIAQCLTLLAVIVAVWFLAPADATERSPAGRLFAGIPYEWLPYRHVLLAVVGLVAIAILLGSVLARSLFGSSRGRTTVPQRLARVELFVPLPNRPPVTGSMFLLAALGAITTSPERVAFPAALVTVLVDREWVNAGFFGGLAVALVLVAFARLDARFSASWNLLHRVFFGGWSGIISVLVIAIGVARVLDVQYASTVLDGARSFTLGGYLLAAYAVTWWFDYWMSTAAAIRFLDLLGGRGGADDAQIPYPIAIHPSTSVPAAGRVIQAHGAGRLLVLHDHQVKPYPYFQSYSLAEMTDGLCAGLKQKNPTRMDLEWIRWRLAAHMLLTSVIMVVLLVGAGWLLHRRPQQAQIAAPADAPTNPGLDVRATVFPDTACKAATPVIAIAASGGGTRAALYTTAVLERLYHLGQLPNVTVMSGVSGGGAALAYFAVHRDLLLADGDAGQDAWNTFYQAMQEPYIEDVIDGSGEWRMASDDRLGRLLAESFERRWRERGGTSMAAIRDVGLLLNSAIAGRFVRDTAAGDSPVEPIGVVERQSGGRGRSDVAGGRVVYTNLNLDDHLRNEWLIDEAEPRATRDSRLPIFVVKGAHVRVAAATAANANFPPVFSNTAIDRDKDMRLWVTDGGAVDNRGTETLLMAIRNAVASPATDGCATVPPLHIVEVEASAFSDGYSQDRGIGSVISAGTAFASQLDADLLAGLRRALGSRERVAFHYLPMPRLLRQSGSFGTHWMMQKNISVCQDQKCRWSLALTGDEVVTLLRSLDKDPNTDPTDVSDVKKAHTLIRRDKEWPGNWSRLCQALSPGRC